MCCHRQTLITSENIGDVLSALAWPVAALVILLVVVLAFLKQIKALIGKITRLEAAGVSLNIHQVPALALSPSATPDRTVTQPESASDVMPWNGYNAFWLGHDMMWIVDVLLRGASGERIRHGFDSAIAHLSALSLEDKTIMGRLKRLQAEAKQKNESDWTPEVRKRFADDIGGLIADIGKYTQRFVGL